MTPFFSVVLATYARGRHIAPTIESVLMQSHADWELLVVGDGCTDETEAVVARFRTPKIAWTNLPRNYGNQSFPNNAGIAAARGQWIAYIGHDDIWTANHLARLGELIDGFGNLDFAVSGCVCWGPEGSEITMVSGLFEGSETRLRSWFPPSSLAHRKDVVTRIGGWRDPRSIRAPVDCDFLLRAAQGGLRFGSTGTVTVHKFTAGHRYLCYVSQTSDEQSSMLAALIAGSAPSSDEICAEIRKREEFMGSNYPDFSAFTTGQLFDISRSKRGLTRPRLAALTARVVITQTEELRAVDWHALQRGRRSFRWSGPNPRPKILIPFTFSGFAIITIFVEDLAGGTLADVGVEVNGERTSAKVGSQAGAEVLVVRARLKRADYSVITLHTPHMAGAIQQKRGIAVSDVIVEPDKAKARTRILDTFRCLLKKGGFRWRKVELASKASRTAQPSPRRASGSPG